MKNIMSKRVVAYLLDAFLVYLFIVMASNIKFLNPTYDKLLNVSETYNEAVASFEEGKITEEEYLDINEQYIYDATKYNVSTNIIFVVVVFLYYCLFQKFNNGQTLGKKIMKIRVVGEKNNNIGLGKYLLRILPLYFIFIGSVIPYIISSILVYFMSVSSFAITYSVLVYVFLFLGIVSLVMSFKREDKKGLHDLIAGTKVIEE